jgi:uncharacterized Zn finger protein (UPF0148 family)
MASTENTYALCACGHVIRFDKDGRRVPCAMCGGTATKDEVEQQAKEAEKQGWA